MSELNAWKLTRVEPRERPRTDWPQRWQAAGDACGWQGALHSPMIALKSSPIWVALGSGVGGFDDALGNDYPPFAYESGMGWIAVDFEAEKENATMNNENKIKLLGIIVNHLNDEQCENILMHLQDRLSGEEYARLTARAEWDESKHPRAEDGKWTDGPSRNYGPFGDDRHKHMRQDEAKRWDRIGKGEAYDKRLTKKKAEIAKLQRRQSMYKKGCEKWNDFESKIVKGQRELAELERDIKLEKRSALESKVTRRVNAKKIKQYQEIDEEIDYIEEKYADRNPNSETQGEIVFPKTKKGEKQKAKYERLIAERDELNEEIDWELADKGNDEEED